MNNFLFFYNFVISCKVLARLIINFAVEFVRGKVSSHVQSAFIGEIDDAQQVHVNIKIFITMHNNIKKKLLVA